MAPCATHCYPACSRDDRGALYASIKAITLEDNPYPSNGIVEIPAHCIETSSDFHRAKKTAISVVIVNQNLRLAVDDVWFGMEKLWIASVKTAAIAVARMICPAKVQSLQFASNAW